MNTHTRNFYMTLILVGLLGLVVITPLAEVFSFLPVHTLPGLALSGLALTHLLWHRVWIVNAFRRFQHLPPPARTNALLDAALFAAYSLALFLALGARLFFWNLHVHIMFAWPHAALGLLIIVLQLIHLVRHWKWFLTTARRSRLAA